jgi:phage gp46-like protein
MTDIYQGDPQININENGASLNFVGGQPTMDRGLENLGKISLFTEPGWAGNTLFDEIDQQAGSKFEEISRQPITLQMLNDLRNAAENALDNPAFGNVEVSINNPSGYRLNVTITLSPPGQDIKTLLLTKNGLNWIAQALDPAHLRG